MGKLKRSTRNNRWIEHHCHVPEGEDVGKPVRLRPWQKREMRKIYDNPHGTRRAILSFGRKNGKTAFVAMLLLLHLVGPEARPNSQLNSAAMSRDQAAILFNLAVKMVRLSEDLAAFVTVRESAKVLYCEELGTTYRALSADAPTAFGLSPVFIVHDELGQVRGPRSSLYEALETATGGQKAPLSVIISTQAPTDGDLLSILIDDALAGHDPRVVCSLYAAPDDIDPFSQKALKLANPAFGDFQNADEVRAMARDAERMPARENEYRNLVLNQRVEAHSPFISKAAWLSCSGLIDCDWGDAPVIGALDLSSTTDLTALILAAYINSVWQVRAFFWLPEQGLIERSRIDRVHYDIWESEGYIRTTPGPTIEYEDVAVDIKTIFSEYNIRTVAFDRWGWKYLKPWLEKAEMSEEEVERFAEFGQGYQSMTPALRDLEGMILQKKLLHDNNPVLNMCMANAVVEKNAAGGRKLSKAKSTGRIDGAVCLAMTAGIAVVEEDEEPEYQMMIL